MLKYLRILIRTFLLLFLIVTVARPIYTLTIHKLIGAYTSIKFFLTFIFIVYSIIFYILRNNVEFNNFFWKKLTNKKENILKIYNTYILYFIFISIINLIFLIFVIGDSNWIHFRLWSGVGLFLIPIYLSITIKEDN